MQINLQIFNDKGRLVNRLIRNKSLSKQGKIIWDGRTEQGQLAPSGIYLYHIEIYNQFGYSAIYKDSFVLTLKR